jgi:hypothetical protein
LRLQIYEILAADRSLASLYNLSSSLGDDTTWESERLLEIPITAVCQRLRDEATHFFYSKIWLVIDHCLQYCFKRLVTMDAYGLRCIKGISLATGLLQYSDRKLVFADSIDIAFERDAITVTISRLTNVDCPILLAHDKRRAFLAKKFAEEIESN